MTEPTSGGATNGAPAGLTDAERLAAIEMYLRVLDPIAKALRVRVARDMGRMHVERVGAYLPDGTRMAAVSHSDGRKSARISDFEAALAWCLKNYPDEVETVQTIRPAFLKTIIDASRGEPVGGHGVDPRTGELLNFVEVAQGSPYVTITATEEGVERMTALASGFTSMAALTSPAPGNGDTQ